MTRLRRGTLHALLKWVEEETPRGEFVLVVGGAQDAETEDEAGEEEGE